MSHLITPSFFLDWGTLVRMDWNRVCKMRGGGENKTQADRSHVMRIASNPTNQFNKKKQILTCLVS